MSKFKSLLKGGATGVLFSWIGSFALLTMFPARTMRPTPHSNLMLPGQFVATIVILIILLAVIMFALPKPYADSDTSANQHRWFQAHWAIPDDWFIGAFVLGALTSALLLIEILGPGYAMPTLG